MKTYFIKTYRREESEKVMKVLVNNAVDECKRESSITAYETISFKCEKSIWKAIKKELNLTVTTVFSEIKI